MIPPDLRNRASSEARIDKIDGGWRLRLNEGSAGRYRLAQLDNYSQARRRDFPYHPPLHISLQARSSQTQLPGTWGFGLWNDPFGLALEFGATKGRLPALPNTAWFFFASKENHLALRDQLPGNGAQAAVFRSPKIPSAAFLPTIILAPLLLFGPTARWLRRRAAGIIGQDTVALNIDPTNWHNYEINWATDSVQFTVDGKIVLSSQRIPQPPLALVLWIDNQFAAWLPSGRVRYGTLATSRDCWIEIKDLNLN